MTGVLLKILLDGAIINRWPPESVSYIRFPKLLILYCIEPKIYINQNILHVNILTESTFISVFEYFSIVGGKMQPDMFVYNVKPLCLWSSPR